jgi:hypothetical protein
MVNRERVTILIDFVVHHLRVGVCIGSAAWYAGPSIMLKKHETTIEDTVSLQGYRLEKQIMCLNRVLDLRLGFLISYKLEIGEIESRNQYRNKVHINSLILWHVCRKPELWRDQRQPFLRNGSANTLVAGQWLSKRHVTAAMLTCPTIGLLQAVFSVRLVPRLYNEDQLPLRRIYTWRWPSLRPFKWLSCRCSIR